MRVLQLNHSLKGGIRWIILISPALGNETKHNYTVILNCNLKKNNWLLACSDIIIMIIGSKNMTGFKTHDRMRQV